MTASAALRPFNSPAGFGKWDRMWTAALQSWLRQGCEVEWTEGPGKLRRGFVQRVESAALRVRTADGKTQTMALTSLRPAAVSERERLFRAHMAKAIASPAYRRQR